MGCLIRTGGGKPNRREVKVGAVRLQVRPRFVGWGRPDIRPGSGTGGGASRLVSPGRFWLVRHDLRPRDQRILLEVRLSSGTNDFRFAGTQLRGIDGGEAAVGPGSRQEPSPRLMFYEAKNLSYCG